ncbi:unconventional myosin-X-like [Rhinatrema bivittatum]|uniref:unconventional myosin-X-like n=1 Tax=Rhinatrema bivittatum TaxID=194408 RepID=UPI0011294862|nr:unconventional myosin-X-like [Rhinatrema bivittatum]
MHQERLQAAKQDWAKVSSRETDKPTEEDVILESLGMGERNPQELCYPLASLSQETVGTMTSTSMKGVEDISTLPELHQEAVLLNLHLRYQQDQIYTNIGSILVSVNPYKAIADLYTMAAVELYRQHHLGELPPHIFAIANECYRCLWKHHESQCILIRILTNVHCKEGKRIRNVVFGLQGDCKLGHFLGIGRHCISLFKVVLGYGKPLLPLMLNGHYRRRTPHPIRYRRPR